MKRSIVIEVKYVWISDLQSYHPQVVNDEVKKSAEERLASDETLKTLVREKLVPSFQKQLDYVYQSFHGTLNTELQHYSQFTEQVCHVSQLGDDTPILSIL